jgi:CHAD domain-containing protein
MNPQEPPETLWYKQLAALERSWPDVRRGDAEGLHQARVASRRIREALPIVAAGDDPARVRKLGRKVREVTRALGPVRALDVSVTVLAELEGRMGAQKPGFVLLRNSLASGRRRLRRRMMASMDGMDIERLIGRLARLAPREDPNRGRRSRENGAWRGVLAARTLRRAARLREAVESAGALYVPERLHAARIAAKRLRYVLEVAVQAGVPGVSALVPPLKSIQGTLGRLHDMQVLLERGRELHASLGTKAGRDELAAILDALERECRRLHAEFVARHEDLLRLCDGVKSVVAARLAVGRPRAARARLTRRRSAGSAGPDGVAADAGPRARFAVGGGRRG